MADLDEYRCFIGGLSWSTTDRGLKDAFEKFGNVTEAKVVMDRFSGRSRGFGFVTFDDRKAMEEAIEEMNGMDLDGRSITVNKAQPLAPRDHRDRDRDSDRGGRDRDRDRDYGGGRTANNGECFKCSKPGHFARECPSGDGGGRRDYYGGKEDKYGDGASGNGRFGPDRGGDRYSGRSGSGSDRYSRDRSGPYERPSGGGEATAPESLQTFIPLPYSWTWSGGPRRREGGERRPDIFALLTWWI